MPEKKKLIQAIEAALENGEDRADALTPALEAAHPSDVAEVVLSLDCDEMVKVFRMLPRDLAGVVLEEADEPVKEDLLEDLTEEQIADIIDEMAPDAAADVMELLEPEEEREVLGEVAADIAEDIKALRSYDPESAGGIMTTRYIAITERATIGDALEKIRAYPEDESIACVFVVDDCGRLAGIVTLRHVLRSVPSTPVKDLMIDDVISVKTGDDREDVVREIQKYNFTALPVVDEDNVLKGVITVDDAIDALEEENSEDIYRMAGTIARYPTKESTTGRVLKRLPFLLITIVGGFVSAFVLTHFQHTTQEVIILVSFIPIMAGMAGNVGVQSATIIVRGLAIGDISPGKVGRIIFNEIKVGLIVGIVCGGATGLAGALLLGNSALGLVVGVSMVSGITVAAALGAAIPLLCENLKIDPAIASGPFITTLNDITGLTIYLSVATMLLGALKSAA